MAKVVPSFPDPDSPDSEKLVFDLLRSQLPDDWLEPWWEKRDHTSAEAWSLCVV